MITNHSCHQIGRNHGGIHDGLVELSGQHRQQVRSRLIGFEFQMVRTKLACDESCVLRLIVCRITRKPDGEGLDPAAGTPGHCGHETRIHTTAQQYSHWDVSDQLPADRVF